MKCSVENIHVYIFYLLCLFTALPPGDGVLAIDSEPIDNEMAYEGAALFKRDYRTGIVRGTSVGSALLTCVAKRGGAASSSSSPTVQWIRNGEVVQSSVTDTSSLMIDNFYESDVGEYQCMFIDSDSDAEIVTTIPYGLTTGELYSSSLIIASYWSRCLCILICCRHIYSS